MSYETWVQQVSETMRRDPTWGFYGYQKALYLYELTWDDCGLLMTDLRGRAIVEQLVRAVGSISANIEEGFGRGFGKDFTRFLRIALGSARESKGWYFRGRRLLPNDILDSRVKLLDEIIALLVNYINRQRKSSS